MAVKKEKEEIKEKENPKTRKKASPQDEKEPRKTVSRKRVSKKSQSSKLDSSSKIKEEEKPKKVRARKPKKLEQDKEPKSEKKAVYRKSSKTISSGTKNVKKTTSSKKVKKDEVNKPEKTLKQSLEKESKKEKNLENLDFNQKENNEKVDIIDLSIDDKEEDFYIKSKIHAKLQEEPLKNKKVVDENKKPKFIYSSIKNRKKYREEKRTKRLEEEQEKEKLVLSRKNVITFNSDLNINFLSEKLNVPGTELIKKLMSMGVLATLNQKLDFDVASILVSEYGYELIINEVFDAIEEDKIKEEDLELRPPVITVMGHVDHGKTSILDVIRKTDIALHEAGGITQHIGAYQVKTENGVLTFLDTPGHAAFTAMRARGVKITDIAIIVVAANDSVMPQTIEAINHAKAASIPIIIAINKIDLPDANVDRVMQDLSKLGLTPEAWGGDTIMVNVSAKTKEGIHELLEILLLQAEMLELKSTKKGKVKGTVIEAKLDKKKGSVATILVQRGTLRKGDIFICGTVFGKVRDMTDYKGQKIAEVYPSMPVEILGLNGVPEAGDDFFVVENEREAKKIIENKKELIKNEKLLSRKLLTLEDINSNIQNGTAKELNIIIKADVFGSIEALRDSLERLGNDDVKLVVVHSGVGTVNDSDIMLASASKAIIISFNITTPQNVISSALKEGVEIRDYKIIYEVIDEIKSAMEGMLSPVIELELVGTAEVRQVINIPKIGFVAGSMVIDGTISKNNIVKVFRKHKEIFKGKISALKRFKDNVEKVEKNFECGISLVDFSDYDIGDIIEAYVEKKILRKI